MTECYIKLHFDCPDYSASILGARDNALCQIVAIWFLPLSDFLNNKFIKKSGDQFGKTTPIPIFFIFQAKPVHQQIYCVKFVNQNILTSRKMAEHH